MLSNTIADLGIHELDAATIECSPPLMEEVRRLATDGLLAFGHGGLETGGVLYGSRNGDRVSVLAFAELPCEHAIGPSFLLSENDRAALAGLLEPPPGLQTLGWYRSHTRKSLDLDDGDRELFHQFFAGEKILALILKPSLWGPAAAAFYRRETDGTISPATPREFLITPASRSTGKPSLRPDPCLVPALVAPPPAESQPAILASGENSDPVSRVNYSTLRPWMLRFLMLLAVLVAGASAAYYWPRPARSLALKAYSITPGQLRIDWNHRSSPVMNGASGVLRIRDGESETSIPLDRSQLAASSITYTQKSGHISVGLRVEPARRGAAAIEESVEFVGPVQPAAPVEPVPAPAIAPAVTPAASAASPPLETVPAEPPARKVELPLEPPPRVSAAPRRKFQLPASRPITPAAGVPVLPSAPLASTALALQSPLQAIVPTIMAPPKPTPAVEPRSGRLIWTGQLARRGVVEIEGAHASIGSLSGSLTGVPVDLRIYPAEFTHGGLDVFTLDGAQHGRAEAPSKLNGWNRVVYQFDPDRVSELVVLEAPNRVNGFKRLVLRNDARACPVIIVDWTVH